MVKPEQVDTKLGKLEQYLSGLEEKQKVSKSDYLADQDLKDIVERRFEKAIQACLNVASHIVAEEGFREPGDYGDLFQILGKEDVLDSEMADKMVEMAGFRNVLAHEYSGIKDERVYEHLQGLEKFREFARQIKNYVDRGQ